MMTSMRASAVAAPSVSVKFDRTDAIQWSDHAEMHTGGKSIAGIEDPKFKMEIERALKRFEHATEWADLITCLTKLNRVLSSNAKLGNLPCSIMLSRRIAQCLNPNLPSGVHLKAIESYRIVLEILDNGGGPNAVAKYGLPILAIGCFPLLSNASIPVRKALLDLYDDQVLPIKSQIAPALTGFLAGTLHGLEEGSEFVQRTNDLLETIESNVGRDVFYNGLWTVCCNVPSVRLHAVGYVVSHIEKSKSLDDQLHIAGQKLDLMVSGLVVSLADSQQPLVQRAALDLLVSLLPLHSGSLLDADVRRLMLAVITCVLRRDNALTRRISTWLTSISDLNGTAGSGTASAALYYEKHGLPQLVLAICERFNDEACQPDEWTRLCRCLTYLLDLDMIGTVLLPRVLLELLYRARHFCLRDASRDAVVKTLNMLMSALQPGFMWCYLGEKLLEAQQGNGSVERLSDIIDFCLEVLELNSDLSIRRTHIPSLLEKAVRKLNSESLNIEEQQRLLESIRRVLSSVEQTAPPMGPPPTPKSSLANNVSSEEACSHSVFATRSAFLISLPKLIGCFNTTCAADSVVPLVSFVKSVIDTLRAFNDFPIYVRVEEMVSKLEKTNSNDDTTSEWFCALTQLCLCCARGLIPVGESESHWSIETLHLALPVLLRITRESVTLWEQCDLLRQRKKSSNSRKSSLTHTRSSSWSSRVIDTTLSLHHEPEEDAGVAPILLVPLASRVDVDSVCSSDEFSTTLISLLWACIDSAKPSLVALSAELFVMLHEVELFDSNAACEDIVLDSLASKDMAVSMSACRKACAIWQTYRRLATEQPADYMRPWSRLAVALLSHLYDNTSPLHAPCASWLRGCFTHGDVHRVLEPLLSILSQPSMARTSIMHLTLARCTDAASRNVRFVLRSNCTDSISIAHAVQRGEASDPSSPRSSVAWLRSSMESLIPRTPVESSWAEETVEETVMFVVEDLLHTIDILEANDPPAVYETDDAPTTTGTGHAAPSVAVDALSLCATDITGGPDERATVEQSVHPLHAHALILHDPQALDLRQIQTVWSVFSTMLRVDPGLVLGTLMVVGLTHSQTEESSKLSDLLHRHRRTILGHDFWSNSAGRFTTTPYSSWQTSPVKKSDVLPSQKRVLPQSYAELCLAQALSLLRSYCPNSTGGDMTSTIEALLSAKCYALQFLNELLKCFSRLVEEDSTPSTAHTLLTLISACKLQMLLMHFLALVAYPPSITSVNASFFPFLFKFNIENERLMNAYQHQLLKLMEQVVNFEHSISRSLRFATAKLSSMRVASLPQPICTHRLFLNVLLSAVRCDRRSHLDQQCGWLDSLITSLPYFGEATATLTLHCTEQLCGNLVLLISDQSENAGKVQEDRPLDFVRRQLEALTALVHYCLLDIDAADSTPAMRLTSRTAALITPSSNMSLVLLQHQASDDMFTEKVDQTSDWTNVFKPWSWSGTGSSSSSSKFGSNSKSTTHREDARLTMLGALPHLLASVVDIWETLHEGTHQSGILRDVEALKRLILQLVEPIALNHSKHFITSLAMVWMNKRIPQTCVRRQSLTAAIDPLVLSSMFSSSQLSCVDLLLKTCAMPFSHIIDSAAKALRDPVKIKRTRIKSPFPVEIFVLEIVYAYMLRCQTVVVRNARALLLIFINDALGLTSFSTTDSQAPLLLFRILCDYLRLCGPPDDKRDLRQMQDACCKLVDRLSSVVGELLEQQSLLKRERAVRQDALSAGDTVATKSVLRGSAPDLSRNEYSPEHETRSLVQNESVVNLVSLAASPSKDEETHQRTLNALSLLADELAPCLDALFKSDDKDRLTPLLTGLWYNIGPYLRCRSRRNALNFVEVSRLLATLAEFRNMRSHAWRTEALKLLLEPQFFEADEPSLRHWMTIVDNLITHDKTTFKELLGKMQASTTGIILSREQEYDNRRNLLERIAFTVLSGEIDQYHPYLPDIQEKLSENLRLSTVPSVLSAVMLCMRALIVRFSPHNLEALWPPVLAELLQSMQYIEEEVACFAVPEREGRADVDPSWLQLYLCSAKLLAAIMCIPSSYLVQFQMFEWMFGRSNLTGDSKSAFVTQSESVVGLWEEKMRQASSKDGRNSSIKRKTKQINNSTTPEVILTILHQHRLSSIADPALCAFVRWLATRQTMWRQSHDLLSSNTDESVNNARALVEKSVLVDLCRLWSSS